MQAVADRHGARLAPHGTTTMSAEPFDGRLDAGAWAITGEITTGVCRGNRPGRLCRRSGGYVRRA